MTTRWELAIASYGYSYSCFKTYSRLSAGLFRQLARDSHKYVHTDRQYVACGRNSSSSIHGSIIFSSSSASFLLFNLFVCKLLLLLLPAAAAAAAADFKIALILLLGFFISVLINVRVFLPSYYDPWLVEEKLAGWLASTRTHTSTYVLSAASV